MSPIGASKLHTWVSKSKGVASPSSMCTHTCPGIGAAVCQCAHSLTRPWNHPVDSHHIQIRSPTQGDCSPVPARRCVFVRAFCPLSHTVLHCCIRLLDWVPTHGRPATVLWRLGWKGCKPWVLMALTHSHNRAATWGSATKLLHSSSSVQLNNKEAGGGICCVYGSLQPSSASKIPTNVHHRCR